MDDEPTAELTQVGYTRFTHTPRWEIRLRQGGMVIADGQGGGQSVFRFHGTKKAAREHAQNLLARYFPPPAAKRDSEIIHRRGWMPTTPPRGRAGSSR